jgi:hypothetical protein
MPPKKETTEIVGVAAAMDAIQKKYGTTAIRRWATGQNSTSRSSPQATF